MLNKKIQPIQPFGSGHRMPAGFHAFYIDLLVHPEVEWVGGGEFKRLNKVEEVTYTSKYFNADTRTIKVTVAGAGFKQDIYVRVKSGSEEVLEDFIRNY